MKALIIIVIVAAILAVGGFFLFNPSAEEANVGVVISGEGGELRVVGEGQRGFGGIELVISPANSTTISGIVLVEAEKVPAGSEIVAFVIKGSGIEEKGKNIGVDIDGSDGWKIVFDTTRYANGEYDVVGVAGVPEEGALPTAGVSAKVTIEN